MYIEFDIVTSMDSFDSLKDTVNAWANRYKIPYTSKTLRSRSTGINKLE